MTIYDIAKEAGVSASTVSRVINNKPGIKASTRDRVNRLLKKYNYSPNETARGLVNQATKIIGILLADIRNVHHTDGAYYIERELAGLGYCCIMFNTGTDDRSKAEAIERMEKRRVEGAVLIGSTFQTESVKKSIERHLSNVPIVIANGYLDLPNVYGVLADEKQGVSSCVRLLVNRGKKNLAYVNNDDTASARLKQQGFKEEMCSQKLRPVGVYNANATYQGGYEVTRRIMEEHPETDGIIYAVDLLAAAGLRALWDLQLEVPRQVAVVGIDNSVYGELCNPKLTSLDNKLTDMSIQSAQILISQLRGGLSPKQIILPSSLVERETT